MGEKKGRNLSISDCKGGALGWASPTASCHSWVCEAQRRSLRCKDTSHTGGLARKGVERERETTEGEKRDKRLEEE